MSLLVLLLIVAGGAFVVQVTRYWRPLSFVATLATSVVILWSAVNLTSDTVEFGGLTFTIQPLAHEYVVVGLGLSGALALATTYNTSRSSLGFTFLSWVPWLIALAVNDFVLGVLAWGAGLVVLSLAMQPKRIQRAGGAAYYLVIVIVGAACLVVAHRFIELYPLTPDQVSLLQSAVLFIAWGLGLVLALVPFNIWLGPAADETPLPIIALLLGLGQPIGLWLLISLLGQTPRLIDLTDLLTLMTYAGVAAVVVGGFLCLFERRAGRLLSFAALFTMGMVLLDLSRGTRDDIAYSALEVFSRALGLTIMAVSITIGTNVNSAWTRRVAVGAFLLGGLDLAGLRIGVSLAERWTVLVEVAPTNALIFWALVLAHIGVMIGVVTYVSGWLRSEWREFAAHAQPSSPLEVAPAFSMASLPALPGALTDSNQGLIYAAPTSGPDKGGPDARFTQLDRNYSADSMVQGPRQTEHTTTAFDSRNCWGRDEKMAGVVECSLTMPSLCAADSFQLDSCFVV